MSKGFGDAVWWGFSPALDLLQPVDPSWLESSHQDFAPPGAVNLLVVGAGDLRHILKTMESSYVRTSRPLHFYVVEHSIETIARHLLFLSLVAEQSEKLGLQEKVELFMELFGNILVRAQTDQYLKRKATELIKIITECDQLKTSLPFVDISMLKFKDKDVLEVIFKRWKAPPPTKTLPQSHWDSRLRQYLGSRYDTRSGIADWDYHMKLSEMAPPLSGNEYTRWRNVGVAFQLRSEASYDVVNNTLLSYKLIRHGLHDIPVCGYWGDIVSSPYLSFGLESDDKKLMKDHTGEELKKSSQTITEHNLLALFHWLLTGDLYKNTSSNVCLPVVVEDEKGFIEVDLKKDLETEELKVKEEGEMKEEKKEECNKESTYGVKPKLGPLFSDRCQIFFLSPSLINDMMKKSQFKHLFNVAYFSNSMVHTLKDGIRDVFAPNCVVITETAQYILDLTKDQKTQFLAKSTELATSAGLKSTSTLTPPTSTGSTHLYFSASPVCGELKVVS